MTNVSDKSSRENQNTHFMSSNVNRDKLWEIMENRIPNYLLNTIKNIYRNTRVRIKFNDGISEPIHTKE
jgi:hypothetical protein